MAIKTIIQIVSVLVKSDMNLYLYFQDFFKSTYEPFLVL